MNRQFLRTLQAAHTAPKQQSGFSGGRHMRGSEWKPRECRWPKGERPNYDFCCAAVVPGKPYCHEHCEIAYTNFGGLVDAAE
jgi:hypothetical protein